MGFLSGVTKSDLDGGKIIFNAKEVVEFLIEDFLEDAQTGNLKVRCRIKSGSNADKQFTHFISRADNAFAKKQYAQFLKAFWTEDELLNGKASLAKLSGRKFQARAGQAREYNGDTFQNFDGFVDLGLPGQTAETTPQNVSF